VLIASQTLDYSNHITHIQWVNYSYDGNLKFAITERNYWKMMILDDSRTTTVHQLYKFPHPLIDDEIVLLLTNISSKHIFIIKQLGIIDTSQFLSFYMFEKGSIEL